MATTSTTTSNPSQQYLRYALAAQDPGAALVLLELVDDRAVTRAKPTTSDAAFTVQGILDLAAKGRVGHARLATACAAGTELAAIIAATLNPRIRSAVITNPAVTIGVLAELAAGSNRAIADRAKAKLGDRGITNPAPSVLDAIRSAENAASDPAAAVALAGNGTIEEQLALAGAIDTTPEAQIALVHAAQDPTVLDVLANRPDLDHDASEAFVAVKPDHRLPFWPRGGTEAQIAHASRTRRYLGADLATLPPVSSRTLQAVFEHADDARDQAFVWDLLCRAEADPSWTHRALAGEFGNVAKRRAWSSPHVPTEDLDAALDAAIASLSVRQLEMLARNPALAGRTRQLLAIAKADIKTQGWKPAPGMRIAEALASNPAAPPDVLVQLATIPQLVVAVLRNPSASHPGVIGNVPEAHTYGPDPLIAGYLTARFGLDRDAWTLGIGWLDQWTGTLAEFADTVTGLNDLQRSRQATGRRGCTIQLPE